jgi:hypothetical protein
MLATESDLTFFTLSNMNFSDDFFGRELTLKAVSGVAHPQGGLPVAVFYPFGHPIPYAYGCLCLACWLERGRPLKR